MGAPHPQGPRRIVAVSGGIGSGKSSVTRVFATQGAVTADADAIAREILEPGEPALSEVARAFGGDLLRQDGSLDRALLASRVFGGEGADERVARLNAITHPLIEARAWSILRGAPEGSLAVYDIPLLIEGDHVDLFDAVVIVDAPIEERVKRLEGRGVAPEDARARIRAQASSQERRAIATIWIDNEGSSDDLEEVARLVYERWLTPDAPVTV
ncbi:dephospho-CoA kinase [Schaalia dentiphila]|uniref:dephospho-CoA kinase n=1 Tax=Schaalia dentiphila TaxID=3050224 RepID=UPI002852B761|nr:dephospho-CoA kinase [Schaalia sp. C24]